MICLNLSQEGNEFLDLFLLLFAMLATHVLVVHDGLPFDRYLVVRVHEAEGGLQEREAIGGLLRDIEEYLRAIYDPLPLCWEPPSRQ